MKRKQPTRRMREHPDLEQLKRQAKELLRGFASGDTNAIADVNAHYPSASPTEFALHDAQLVIARSYGFESWPKLKAYVDGVTVKRLADAVNARTIWPRCERCSGRVRSLPIWRCPMATSIGRSISL